MRSPPATMPRRGEAGTLLWLCDCCNRGISRLQVLLLSNSVRDFPLRPPVLDKPMNLIEVRADGCICHRASDVWISCIRCNGSMYPVMNSIFKSNSKCICRGICKWIVDEIVSLAGKEIG